MPGIINFTSFFDKWFSRRGNNRINRHNISVVPKEKVLPKGARYHSFDDGFKCVAINEENAIRKHNNFLKATSGTL